MKVNFTPVLLLLVALNTYSQRVTLAKDFSTTSYPYVNSIQFDKSGNYILPVSVDSTIVFGNDTFNNATGAFIASIDTTGQLNWIKPMGAANYQGAINYPPYAICDSKNRLFVLGVVNGLEPVGDSLVNYGSSGDFLARFDANGTLIWVKNIGHKLFPSCLTEDHEGNLIVGGYNADTTYIGTNLITLDIVLAKFDTTGNLIWLKSAGTTSPFYGDMPLSVSCDANSNIYVGGMFRNNIRFDNIPLNLVPSDSLQGGYIGFVAKYDAGGNALWATYSGYWCQSVAVDSAGNCYAGGYTYGGDPYDTVNSAVTGWYVAKFNTSGRNQWVRGGNNMAASTSQVAVDAYGNCYASGIANDSFSMLGYVPPANLCRIEWQVAFTVAFDPYGNPLWVKNPCNSSAAATSIGVNNCNIAVAGRYRFQPFNIDTFSLPFPVADSSNYGISNIFLVAMDTCGYQIVNSIPAENISSNFTLYPNPGNGSFRIITDFETGDVSDLTIADINGNIVYSGRITGGDNTIHSDLPSGFYLVNIFNNHQNMVRKMIVAR